MIKQTTLALAVAVAPLTAFAVESQLSGNLQVQGAYGADSSDESERWLVETPNSWLGVSVSEGLPGSRFNGVWQFELDGLAEEPEARTRQMYLEWQLPLYQVRAGRVETLESLYVVRPVSMLNGQAGGGSASGAYVNAFAPRAFQLEVSDGDFAFASLELGLGALGEEATIDQWALAGGLDTPEGQLVLSYRSTEVEDDDGLWGFSVNWFQDGFLLAYSHLYQSDTVAWDVAATYQAGSVVSKLMYSRDAVTDVGTWSLGFDQRFSPSLRHYSEARWQSEDGLWLFQTGFRLSF